MTEASEVPFGLEITKGIIGKILMAALGFIGTILFSRILGPNSFGGFYLLWTVVGIAKLPIDGFSAASKKRFSETDADRPAIAGAILLLVLALSGIGVLLATIFRGPLVTYTGLPNAHFLFGVLFFTVALFSPFQSMITGMGHVSRTIWIDFLRSILTTPLQLAFVLLSFGAAGMAYGLSLATALTIPVTQYVLGTRPRLPGWDTFRELWSFARHSIISVTLGRVYNRLDMLLLGMLLTPAAAANYQVALKLTIPAVLISQVMGDGLMPRVSNLESKGAAVGPDVTNSLAFASVLAIPLFFGAAVLARPLIVTVYGAEYTGAATLLVGLALFRVFRTQANPLTQALNGIDRPDINVRISGFTLVFNVVLGVFLTLRLGAIGVVIATVLAEGVTYAAAAFAVHRLIDGVELLPVTLIDQVVAALGMAVVVFGTFQVILVRSWAHLLVLVGLGAVAYGLGLLALSAQFRHTVRSILADAGLLGWLPDRFAGR